MTISIINMRLRWRKPSYLRDSEKEGVPSGADALVGSGAPGGNFNLIAQNKQRCTSRYRRSYRAEAKNNDLVEREA